MECVDFVIGERLKAALILRKVKQKELASHLGVTDNTISYYCSGKRTPNVQQIAEISKYLGVSADYLLGLSNTPTTDADLSAVCEYLGLSQKAVETLVQDKRKNFNTTSKVLESAEFWEIVEELRFAAVNKEYLEPNGDFVLAAYKDKISKTPRMPEAHRRALALLGVQGLSAVYKYRISEQIEPLFKKVVYDET